MVAEVELCRFQQRSATEQLGRLSELHDGEFQLLRRFANRRGLRSAAVRAIATPCRLKSRRNGRLESPRYGALPRAVHLAVDGKFCNQAFLDCGGKRQRHAAVGGTLTRPKAVSPLRSATAVQQVLLGRCLSRTRGHTSNLGKHRSAGSLIPSGPEPNSLRTLIPSTR
jgi:hypothetical protein